MFDAESFGTTEESTVADPDGVLFTADASGRMGTVRGRWPRVFSSIWRARRATMPPASEEDTPGLSTSDGREGMVALMCAGAVMRDCLDVGVIMPETEAVPRDSACRSV